MTFDPGTLDQPDAVNTDKEEVETFYLKLVTQQRRRFASRRGGDAIQT